MAKFDAGKAVEALEYDFTTVPGGKGKGTVPEPSTKDMEKFQKAFSRINRDAVAVSDEVEKALKDGGNLTEEAEEAFEKRSEELAAELDKAVAKLCSDSPSVDEMSSLPFRHKQAFATWLLGEFSPEAGKPATNS